IDEATDRMEKVGWFASVGKIALMLEGYAVEMLAKAILVSRRPELVGDGRWSGPQKGHPLPELLALIRFEPESAEQKDLVSRLAGFVAWAGRYPIPKDYRESLAKLKGEDKLELAPGTYYSTSDRDHVDRLIVSLNRVLRERP